MTENKKPDNRRIKMGDKGNYNELIGRDYIQGDVYHINISQDKNSQALSDTPKFQHFNNSDNKQSLVISSSGNWVLIKGYFFKSTKISTHRNNTVTVKIYSESAEEDANIRSLRPDRYWHSNIISFAYRNDGYFVKVESIEEEFEEEICIWSITLKPENIQYGGDAMEFSYQGDNCYYSAADIAELAGRRILLNNPPKPSREDYHPLSDDSMLESLISSPLNRNIKVDSCILKELYAQFKDRPQKYLEVSRLAAIFYLKAANVIEQVLELSLELIEPNKVSVKFRGKRRKMYLNKEPIILEIEGDCLLV